MRLLLEDESSVLLLENTSDTLLLESDGFSRGYRKKRRYIIQSKDALYIEKLFGIDIEDGLDDLLSSTIVHKE